MSVGFSRAKKYVLQDDIVCFKTKTTSASAMLIDRYSFCVKNEYVEKDN